MCGAARRPGVLPLDSFLQHVPGLGLARAESCADADLEGPRGERYRVLHGEQADTPGARQCSTTPRRLTRRQRAALFAERVCGEVIGTEDGHASLSILRGVAFEHALGLVVRWAGAAPVRLTIGGEVAHLPADRWTAAAAPLAAKAALGKRWAAAEAGECALNFEVRVPRAHVCFAQEGLSMKRLREGVGGGAVAELADALRRTPFYVVRAVIGISCSVSVVPGPRHAGRLLVTSAARMREAALYLGARQGLPPEVLVPHLDSWLQEADADGPQAWHLLWVEVAPCSELLTWLEPAPRFPTSDSTVLLAVRSRLCLRVAASALPKAREFHAALIGELAAALGLQQEQGVVSIAASDARAEEDCCFVEVAFLAGDRELAVAVGDDSEDGSLSGEHPLPLRLFFLLSELLRSGRLSGGSDCPLLRHADARAGLVETERLFLAEPSASARRSDLRSLLRVCYASEALIAQRRAISAARAQLRFALGAARGGRQPPGESILSIVRTAIARLKAAAAATEIVAPAEQALSLLRAVRLKALLQDAMKMNNKVEIWAALCALERVRGTFGQPDGHDEGGGGGGSLAAALSEGRHAIWLIEREQELLHMCRHAGTDGIGKLQGLLGRVKDAGLSPEALAGAEEKLERLREEVEARRCHGELVVRLDQELQQALEDFRGLLGTLRGSLHTARRAVRVELLGVGGGSAEADTEAEQAQDSPHGGQAAADGLKCPPARLIAAARDLQKLGVSCEGRRNAGHLSRLWREVSVLLVSSERVSRMATEEAHDPGVLIKVLHDTRLQLDASLQPLLHCCAAPAGEPADAAQQSGPAAATAFAAALAAAAALLDCRAKNALVEAIRECSEVAAHWLEVEREAMPAVLARAVAGGDGELAAKLLSWSSDPCALARRAAGPGREPLCHLAAATGREDLLRLLADYGADFQAEDAEGRTPLDVAIAQMHGAHDCAEAPPPPPPPGAEAPGAAAPPADFEGALDFLWLALGVRSRLFVLERLHDAWVPRPKALEDWLSLRTLLEKDFGTLDQAFAAFRNAGTKARYRTVLEEHGLPGSHLMFYWLSKFSGSRRNATMRGSLQLFRELDEGCTATAWQDHLLR